LDLVLWTINSIAKARLVSVIIQRNALSHRSHNLKLEACVSNYKVAKSKMMYRSKRRNAIHWLSIKFKQSRLNIVKFKNKS
jgi:hypothetical protein